MKPSGMAPALVLAALIPGIPDSNAGLADGGRDGGWKLQPAPKPWVAEGFAESLDLSGLASVDGRHCLVASDELIAVQVGQLDPETGRITAGAMVSLGNAAGKKKAEIDIEGVAADPAGRTYYVTGSHGVGKKKGDVQAERYAVYKVPVDPATGAVRREEIRKSSLRPWMERTPEWAAHLGQPLQHNGLNIEGLAFADGKLYFGLRGPNVEGHAFVIEVGADALFSGAAVEPVVHRLPLGAGRGVRDLVACRDGFLFIAGNASAEASKAFPVSEARQPDTRFQLGWWRPGTTPSVEWIGDLTAGEGKAEALLVLEDAGVHIDVVCLFDGAPDGGATAYRLNRPALTGAPARP